MIVSLLPWVVGITIQWHFRLVLQGHIFTKAALFTRIIASRRYSQETSKMGSSVCTPVLVPPSIGAMSACADPENFAKGGPTLIFYEGREDPNSTKEGHRRPASETPFQ